MELNLILLAFHITLRLIAQISSLTNLRPQLGILWKVHCNRSKFPHFIEYPLLSKI